MAVSAINGNEFIQNVQLNSFNTEKVEKNNTTAFENLLSSAINMY